MPKKKPEKLTVELPINPAILEKVNRNQRFYLGGAILVILSSFLPWVSISMPNLGSIFLGGAKNVSELNIWSFGITSFPVLLYILPLIALGYVSYQEIMKEKVYTPFIKILLLIALCLGTVATNINVFSIVFGVQSLLVNLMRSFGGEAIATNFMQIGFGLYGGLIGSGLMIYGLLVEIKEKTSTK